MPNAVYTQSDQTIIKWADSGGTETMTLASLAASAGRNGAMHDFGDASRPRWYAWVFFCRFNTTPVVGETVEIYWREGTEDTGLTLPSNDDGTTDTALSAADKRKNLKLIGVLVVDEAATGVTMAVHGDLFVNTVHGGPVIYNATADALSATAADNGFWMRPIPDEIQ